ncbi:hypothetical protein [Acetobacter senegalensis]|uniref:hypothetical protein n=1 Tax=Acetobacter senegalensis TaxID=446692 RepID=UPI00264B8778|nr:hypothetical protein [Acetobacter senegalensis]MDN7354335.1 hypothetical protein [Acetobacter senegalensis]
MPRGGARPGAGRKKKVANPEYRGPEIENYATLTPVGLWLRILRDPNADITWRLGVADKLAPYMHARLAPKQIDDPQGELLLDDQSAERTGFSALPPPMRH